MARSKSDWICFNGHTSFSRPCRHSWLRRSGSSSFRTRPVVHQDQLPAATTGKTGSPHHWCGLVLGCQRRRFLVANAFSATNCPTKCRFHSALRNVIAVFTWSNPLFVKLTDPSQHQGVPASTTI